MRDEVYAQLNRLLETCGGEVVRDVVDVYLETTPSDIDLLDQITQNKKWTALAEMAHRMKGTVASLGASELSAQALALEQAAKASESKQIQEVVKQLKMGLLQLRSILSSYRNEKF